MAGGGLGSSLGPAWSPAGGLPEPARLCLSSVSRVGPLSGLRERGREREREREGGRGREGERGRGKERERDRERERARESARERERE